MKKNIVLTVSLILNLLLLVVVWLIAISPNQSTEKFINDFETNHFCFKSVLNDNNEIDMYNIYLNIKENYPAKDFITKLEQVFKIHGFTKVLSERASSHEWAKINIEEANTTEYRWYSPWIDRNNNSMLAILKYDIVDLNDLNVSLVYSSKQPKPYNK